MPSSSLPGPARESACTPRSSFPDGVPGVFASMRDMARAENLVSVAEQAGLTVAVVQLDVTSESSVRNAVTQVVSDAGRLDVVVNNAGVFTVGPIECADERAVESIFQTNIIGVIRVIRHAIPVMRRQGGGRIVNVGSVGAEPRLGFPLMSLYGATKAALHAPRSTSTRSWHRSGSRPSSAREGSRGTHRWSGHMSPMSPPSAGPILLTRAGCRSASPSHRRDA